MPHTLTDSWTMTRREVAHWTRQPATVLVGLLFPVMILLMFGYLIGGGRGVDGAYLPYLLPGMLALTMAFGLEGTMLNVTQDLGRGVIDRFRSLPMADCAVLVGRSAADMLQSALALAVLLGVGLALGWRTHAGPAALLGAVGLLLLFRFAMLWIGIHLALVAGRPEMVQAVQILVWPVGFLSNALAAPRSMPDWLGTAVAWNPMSHTATAVRDLLGGPGGEPGHLWAAVAWPVGLLAVFLPLAVRRFARLGG
ncbi:MULTISPECIES: ABC transporter permease [unclassified Streptomyces]|uniref:ABC transporter permease n=1 Tax=unclassified Streptomyces TaxID=2593676 RepID=UPI001F0390B5|nr:MULTISPECIES: ABC transporter permease [unclassified Streptomyces]MCH0565108.1 ABC transporter permease [Streptomyces sp. MUM 2J]MCH0571194.1 ABC transporter permease [Streptomyces sp. MUM 136J]